jgi:hypothetical protein
MDQDQPAGAGGSLADRTGLRVVRGVPMNAWLFSLRSYLISGALTAGATAPSKGRTRLVRV